MEMDKQKRENFRRMVSLIKENASGIASALRDDELVGQLGVQRPLAPEKSEGQIEEKIEKICMDVREEIDTTDELWQVMIHSARLIGLDDIVETEQEKPNVLKEMPDIFIYSLGILSSYAVYADEHASTSFQMIQEEILETLVDQRKLSDASYGVIKYWLEASSQEQAMFYFNTLITTARRTLNNLKAVSESSENEISDFVDLYREAGTIYEDALPVMTAFCKNLVNDSIDVERIDKMGIRDYKEQLMSFPRFRPYVEHYDVNIRNAVSHGGNTGVNPNYMTKTVIFRYRIGDEIEKKKMDFEQFRQKALRVASSSVSLLVLPILIVHMDGFIEIRDGILESE